MTQICVLFRPELEPAQKGALPRWSRSAEIVSYSDGERKNAASKVPVYRMKQLTFMPGVNMINAEDYEKAKTFPKSSSRLTSLEKVGAIRIVIPDAEAVLGCSTDFTDETIATQVVNAHVDEKWLEFSLKRENRPSVLEAIKERLTYLEDRKKALA